MPGDFEGQAIKAHSVLDHESVEKASQTIEILEDKGCHNVSCTDPESEPRLITTIVPYMFYLHL